MFGQKVELSDLAGTNDQGASQKVNFDVETLKTSTTEIVDEAIDVQQLPIQSIIASKMKRRIKKPLRYAKMNMLVPCKE